MIRSNEWCCPLCGGSLKYYDKVKRTIRSKYGRKKELNIRRLRCMRCNFLHRELPYYIIPFKQYETDIITGVLEGLITCETLGFEDCPCEITMKRWRSQNMQLL